MLSACMQNCSNQWHRELWGFPSKKARGRGQQFIQERYPGSEVMLFDAFPDSQLEFLTDDCIRGRAIEVMSKLESSSKVYATQLCLPDAMG